jgi:hypothetical protein
MLLRIMNNMVYSDNTIMTRAIAELKKRLPRAWQVEIATRSVQRGRVRADATITVTASDGKQAMLLVEVQRTLEPKDVEPAVEELRSQADAGVGAVLVVAPFLGPRARAKIQAAGAGYIDLAGNMLVSLEKPAIFIERQGADVNPDPTQRPARSLKGAKAARIVRALLDFHGPLGTRQIASLTGTDPGYVSRILDLLDREDLITRRPRGPVERVNWRDLLIRWTQDYSVIESNRVSSYLEPRGIDALLTKLRTLEPDSRALYALTGSLAVPRAATVAPARMGMVYVQDALEWARLLALTPTTTGANVLLIESMDSVAWARSREVDGLTSVSPTQCVADLLTGPGRNPAEGEALLAWMSRNEQEWRSAP